MNRLFVIAVALLLTGCGLPEMVKDDSAPKKASPLPSVQGTARLKSIWKSDIGARYRNSHIQLRPARSEKIIYSVDEDGRVTAFSKSNGQQLWRQDLDEQISAGVGYGDGIATVATESGRVIALNGENGLLLWDTLVGEEILVAPVISDGIVVLRTVSGRVIGLNVSDGKQKWSFRRSVPSLTLRGGSEPVIQKDIVISGFANGKIVASNLQSGRVLWEISVTNPHGQNEVERMVDIDAKPILVGSVVYAGAYQGRVVALALGSRRLLWAKRLSVSRDIGADAENIYVTDVSGTVLALNRLTGETVWQQKLLANRALTSPVPVGEYIVVGDFEGYLHLIRRSDGELVGQQRIDRERAASTPIVDGDKVYVIMKDGTLSAYQASE